jgi:hypothetical protein
MNLFQKFKDFMRAPATQIVLSVVAAFATVSTALRPSAAVAAPTGQNRAPVTQTVSQPVSQRASDLSGTNKVSLTQHQSTQQPLVQAVKHQIQLGNPKNADRTCASQFDVNLGTAKQPYIVTSMIKTIDMPLQSRRTETPIPNNLNPDMPGNILLINIGTRPTTVTYENNGKLNKYFAKQCLEQINLLEGTEKVTPPTSLKDVVNLGDAELYRSNPQELYNRRVLEIEARQQQQDDLIEKLKTSRQQDSTLEQQAGAKQTILANIHSGNQR